jgi:hypothetical protein
MTLSKSLFAVILALLSAMTARLVDDELRLRVFESEQRKWVAQQLADRQEAEKFRKEFDAARKKAPAWGNSANTIKNW